MTFEGGDGGFKGGKNCVYVCRLHALRTRRLCVFPRAWKSSLFGHGNCHKKKEKMMNMVLDEEVGWWLLHLKKDVGDVHFMEVTNLPICMYINNVNVVVF